MGYYKSLKEILLSIIILIVCVTSTSVGYTQEVDSPKQDTIYLNYTPPVYRNRNIYFPTTGYLMVSKYNEFWYFPGKLHNEPAFFGLSFLPQPKVITSDDFSKLHLTDFDTFIKRNGWAHGAPSIKDDIKNISSKYKFFIIKRDKSKILVYEIFDWQYFYFKMV